MSVPKTDYEDKLMGARLEVLAAQSALNMKPSPISPAERKTRGEVLSNVDYWAAHAEEHLIAASKLLAMVHERG